MSLLALSLVCTVFAPPVSAETRRVAGVDDLLAPARTSPTPLEDLVAKVVQEAVAPGLAAARRLPILFHEVEEAALAAARRLPYLYDSAANPAAIEPPIIRPAREHATASIGLIETVPEIDARIDRLPRPLDPAASPPASAPTAATAVTATQELRQAAPNVANAVAAGVDNLTSRRSG